LKCSGLAVGIPEGTQGGSEVGHFTIGAGRVVFQSLEEINQDIKQAAGFSESEVGTGGMVTKLHAALICADKGIPTIITDGREKGVLDKILKGEKIGTLLKPRGKKA